MNRTCFTSGMHKHEDVVTSCDITRSYMITLTLRSLPLARRGHEPDIDLDNDSSISI